VANLQQLAAGNFNGGLQIEAHVEQSKKKESGFKGFFSLSTVATFTKPCWYQPNWNAA